ncbi:MULTISPECIES: RidA family protein [unclassified Bacillus cereus group]|uniref:RidA family protein n=1 Tax=unclassified Bacillus cereus group TaxID=2750818 RepID=UPI001F595769|nr:MULTISPECIES: RidA family protein [unclassified Bacillus cereus group]MDA1676325.1 RidA family protein [Bacillus cereus group sp. TH152-1LC]
MRNGITVRQNPINMPEPVGNYTHITKIPRNAELLVSSGQIRINQDGQFPEGMNEQINSTLKNISKVLGTEELTAANIIKVNIWATEKIDWEHMDFEWKQLFNTEYPAMTIGYISELRLPEIKIEIWAARP